MQKRFAPLRYLFFAFIVRPLILIIIGLRIRNRELLPKSGPALVVANHNSHLDTMVLMSLFPLRHLSKLRPVAAADHFLRNKFMSFFSQQIIGIIPIERKRGDQKQTDEELFAPISEALNKNQIVIFYPEGTRGEPEQMGKLKSGIARLLSLHPEIPTYPLFLRGLGKALPKGEGILVPFFCDAFVGEKLQFKNDKDLFMHELDESFHALVGRADSDQTHPKHYS